MVIEKESWSDGASAVHLVLSPEVSFFFISSVWTLVLLFRGLLITIYIKTTVNMKIHNISCSVAAVSC